MKLISAMLSGMVCALFLYVLMMDTKEKEQMLHKAKNVCEELKG